ncbi:hypothetical protein CF319_g2875 [Tilletia indica]|nr:hypothetical protein CF319_g2875 [Tilletia indica]
MVDTESIDYPARVRVATALRELHHLPSQGKSPQQTVNTGLNIDNDAQTVDLSIHYGSRAVSEYNNPDLFPALYPTLFPFGIGGFETPAPSDQRPIRFSMSQHVNLLFDLDIDSFRTHHAFLFIATNILLRRKAAFLTSIIAARSTATSLVNVLNETDPRTIESLANMIEREGISSNLRPEQNALLSLLNRCTTSTAKLPGSKGAMDTAKSEIRAYISAYGPFHVFLTLNPPAQYSPLFYFIYGDLKVDLYARNPVLPPSSQRPRILASDPVSAADYFDFHIRCVFGHLFGWNFNTRKSNAQGGLLGHVKAFFLSRELTERGNLHGHSVIWLENAPSPSKLRTFMDDNETFQAQYFQWAEDLTWHHLPADEDEVMDERIEPRQQRPLHPSDPYYAAQFRQDHILLGKKFQIHIHRQVCYKTTSGPPRHQCRFRFPHPKRCSSEYDADTQSILLKTLDPWINWHNPHLLVATRHNHDLQIVQSGRSAEAATRYIVDYVMKHDLTVPKGLRAMAEILKRLHSNNSLPSFQKLLRLVVSQIMRISNIHGQKAATYIRGENDTMQSHSTKPLIMPQALFYVRRQFLQDEDIVDPPTNSLFNVGTAVQCENEQITTTNQHEDYLHRDISAHHLSLWEFVKRCDIVSATNAPKQNVERDIYVHDLLPPHPKAKTHVIIERSTTDRLVRLVGSKIPRTNAGNEDQFMFYLAAFKPHAHHIPIALPHQSAEDAWQAYGVSREVNIILENWDEMEHCDDAHDADILRQRSDDATEMKTANSKIRTDLDDDDADSLDESPEQNNIHLLLNDATVIDFLSASQWISESKSNFTALPTTERLDFPITDRVINTWHTEIKTMPTQHDQDIITDQNPSSSSAVAILPDTRTIPFTKKTIVENFIRDSSLTDSQAIAFRLVAHTALFPGSSPLRLLLLGEAGTGKTRVVKLLQELLHLFGEGDAIQVTAPTGKAASLVGGTTQHKAFQLPVFHNKSQDDKSKAFLNSAARLRTLRATYKTRRFLFCDEASMTSLQQLHTIDKTCRTAREKEHTNEWFGGMHAIMAGDLFQLPPVTGAPLYQRPLSNRTHEDNARIAGRSAFESFDSAIIFNEQHRVKDPKTSALYGRIRTRTATEADIDALNTRILANHLHDFNLRNATILVKTNGLRRSLGDVKTRASTTTQAPLMECYAIDSFSIPSTAHLRSAAIAFEPRQPPSSWIPGTILLHENMRVVYRGKNRSVEHGITNGATGTIRKVVLFTDDFNRTCPHVAFVEMDSASFQLKNLPPKWFPFIPDSCSFKFIYTDENQTSVSITIKRRQLKLQPASILTIHTAQGTTMTDGVICDARHGGFLSYVAMSRTTALQNLFLIAPVTLDDINGNGIPPDLSKDMQRLLSLDSVTRSRVQHLDWSEKTANIESTTTSQQHPICRSSTSDDIEMHTLNEYKDKRTQIRATLCLESESTSKTNHSTQPSSEPNEEIIQKEIRNPNIANPTLLHQRPLQGPIWTSNSCAWDCVVVLLGWAMFLSNPEPLHVDVSNLVAAMSGHDRRTVDLIRNRLRDVLVKAYPQEFSPTGYTSTMEILQFIITRTGLTLAISFPCGCHNAPPAPIMNVPVIHDLIDIPLNATSTKERLHQSLTSTIRQALRDTYANYQCKDHHTTGTEFEPALITAAPLLAFNIARSAVTAQNTIPNNELTFFDMATHSNVTYALIGATFLQNGHYTCGLRHPDGTTQTYDSLSRFGLTTPTHPNALEIDIRSADIILYSKLP